MFLTIAVFSVLLLIGCQENSINNPVQDTELQKKIDPSVYSSTIRLEQMFQNPYPVLNSYYVINGEIEYENTLMVLDPIPPNQQSLLSINLTVTANFTELCTVCSQQTTGNSVGTISTQSIDNINISEGGDGIYLLEKSFPIQGRTDGMILMCRFLVTSNGVGLNKMWLQTGNNISSTNNLSNTIQPDPVTYPPVVREFSD